MNKINLKIEGKDAFFGAVPTPVYNHIYKLREALNIACSELGYPVENYIAIVEDRIHDCEVANPL